MSIILVCPTVIPVIAENMNYAAVFLVAVYVAATVYLFAGGSNWYTGPLVEAEVKDSDSLHTGRLKKDREAEFGATHEIPPKRDTSD